VKFLLDHNLSPNLARALGLLVDSHGDFVTCLKDLGWEAENDEDWIPKLAAESEWVIITCDLNIVRNPYRQLVFRRSGLTAFFLLEAWSNGSVRGTEIAMKLLKLWPEISRLAAQSKPGTCFAVPYKGAIYRFTPQGNAPFSSPLYSPSTHSPAPSLRLLISSWATQAPRAPRRRLGL
jgi:hypothetical protein